jgi:DHA1 family tetracycline resistance protein-like MFS transporter
MFRNNKVLASIFLVVFIDLLGFSLILPLLPYYAKTFNANAVLTGLLVASYAAAQFFGAPLLGRLSDRYGRRPILIVSILGTLLGFLLLGVARSLWVLFASRILDGFTGGNLNVAQAYITDVTDAKSRTRGLGMIGAAFGLGFIIGPVAGGLLSQWGFAVPAFAAAGLALINLLLVAFWLPESLPAEKRATSRDPQPLISLTAMTRAIQRPFTGALLVTRFFFGLAFAIFQTIFSLYALTRFNLSAAQTGYILTYVGLLSVFTQGFLVGRLVNRVRDDILIASSVVVMAFCLLGWAAAPSVALLMVVLAPTSLAGGLLTTLLSSTLTRSVPPQEIGGMLGLAASIDSLTRIFAPALGGLLMAGLGTWAPGVFGAVLLAGLSVFVWKAVFNHPVILQRPTVQLTPQPVSIDDQRSI